MKSRNQGGRAIRQNGPYKNNNGKRNGNNHGNNNRRVYVNNLTWETSWQELKDHFKQVGQVVRADILEEPNGRSKGCGIVEFQSPSDAIQAVESLNNSELNGRVIYVREDRESPSKELKKSVSKIGGQQITRSNNPGCRVYVGNLSWDVTWQDLKDHFKSVGFSVKKADIIEDNNGRSRGCGLVEFHTPADADTAIEQLNQSDLMGRQIFIRHDKDDVGPFDKNAQPVVYGDTGEVYGCKLYVGNLSYDTTWQSLKDHFKGGGHVARADVMVNDETGRSKGYGFVEYSSSEEAQDAAKRFNNSSLDGRMIFVREDRDERSKVVKGYN